MAHSKSELRARRHLRQRGKVQGTAERPRLLVTRTLKHIHGALIDDVAGHTLVAASTVQKDVGAQVEGGKGSVAAARVVGTVIAQRAVEKGIALAVFDRNGNQYHGAVKEFAEAAREAGLEF